MVQSFIAVKNQIRFIPDSFFMIKNLKVLDLSNNKLSSISAASIKEAKKLRTLKLNNNSITEMPSAIGQCSELEILELQHNKIAALPDLMSNLTKLRKLWLDHNLIKFLPAWVSRLTKLQELQMSNNRLASYEADAFSGLASLVILDLAHNKLTDKFTSVPRSDFLLRIDLASNYLSGIVNLDRCKNLVELNLEANQFKEVPD